MFSGIKQGLIVLLSISSALVHVPKVSDWTKYLSLNDEPCRPTLTDWNSVKPNYHPYRISLDKCSWS